MIVKNKLTKETLVLSEEEFKTRFAKEIDMALDSYRRTELAKPYYVINKDIESDLYFSLRYNFTVSIIQYGILKVYNSKRIL